jgi:hypothetical protein
MSNSVYDDGVGACLDGKFPTDNPYPPGSDQHIEWMRGWNDMLPIREQWEYANHLRCKQGD